MKKLLILIISILVLSLIYFSINYFFIYQIELNGDKEVIVDVGSKYVDEGAVVKYRGKKTNKYEVYNNVNISKLGNYEIVYKTKNSTKKRIVKLVDKELPIINLNDEIDYVLEINSKYAEPGYEASDNYDGNITNKVIITNNINNTKLGTYLVKYEVKDSSNNITEQIRTVEVKDTIAPVIKLTRKDNSYVILGEKTNLNDFIAFDNYDGDVSDKVIISGDVNFNKASIYEVTYIVSDSIGNESKLVSTINVQKKNTRGIPILMYHWFYDDTKGETADTKNSHNYISKTEFTKQLKYLKNNNFYFPNWQELIDYIDGKIDLPEKSVILTDDDCVTSFFNIALPVAQEYQVPITSFCITKKNTWQDYIGVEYLDFESHTDNMHERICKGSWDGKVMCSDYKDIYEDIKTSVKKITNTYAFAYPFGHYNSDTIKALKENDIKLAFTINDGRVKKGFNKYKLPRVRISSWTSISAYENLVN